MEQDGLKQVKEVFKDYRAINKELLESRIKSMNLFKKTNSLEIIILTNDYIKIRDVGSFENYLKSRFGIKEVLTKIEKESNEEIENITNTERIEKEWIDIIEYLSNKHPMTKAILNNSKISIDGNAANVMLTFKGKDFLIAKKYDDILSNIFKDIYGEKYKVSYIEDTSEEAIKRRQNYVEEMQKQAIMQAEKEALLKKEDIDILNENMGTVNTAVPINSDQIPPIDDKDIVLEEDYLQELEEEENIIFGTISKAKEVLVKIKDIEASNKKITIEGRVVSCQARETKSGKGMIIYDIYDGSGVITCKSFSKNIDEANEILDKIKKASGIKTIRKSKFR